VAIAAGYNHTCAVLASGEARCWGWNAAGQLGDGTTTDSPTPLAVPSLSGVTTIAGGGFHTCAGHADGSVACWGSNDSGQLGDGTTTGRGSPSTVIGVEL
jgi:alpha-tubulin suppressor-like RCC1 family protein